MLYDPKWEKQARAEVSLHDLIAWLEKQPADQSYDYGNSAKCMGAQFLRARGVPDERFVGLSGFALDDFFCGFRSIAVGDCIKSDWTFGAALERARAALASTHGTEP